MLQILNKQYLYIRHLCTRPACTAERAHHALGVLPQPSSSSPSPFLLLGHKEPKSGAPVCSWVKGLSRTVWNNVWDKKKQHNSSFLIVVKTERSMNNSERRDLKVLHAVGKQLGFYGCICSKQQEDAKGACRAPVGWTTQMMFLPPCLEKYPPPGQRNTH